MWSSHKKLAAAAALMVTLSACGESGEERLLRPLDPCMGPPGRHLVADAPNDNVDVLFIIDNSGSMREEQASLAAELPRLIRVLSDGTGERIPDFLPTRSLRVGVVSTDMGTGGHVVATCNEPGFGDDGILWPTAGCGSNSTPRYLGFRRGDGGDVDEFARNVRCLTGLGTFGCGFGQPLDAALKAITPATSEVTFVQSTAGHAGSENGDFVRHNSLLVLIVLTDQDDCSAANPELFNPASTEFPGEDQKLRCSHYGAPELGAVHPVQRYVDGLLAVHPPELVLFGAIVGIPADLAPAPGNRADFGAMLADPRMRERPATDQPGLVPSCNNESRGTAYPPRRIIQVAQGLRERGVRTVIQSICQESLADPIDHLLLEIASVANTTCSRALPQDSKGRALCDLLEVLPMEGEITRCDQLASAGRIFHEIDVTGAEVCKICQTNADGHIIDTNPACQALGGNRGWFYESEEVLVGCPLERPQRISYRPGTAPIPGATGRLECHAPYPPGDAELFAECGDNASRCDSASPSTYPPGLICDVHTRSCQMSCTDTGFCIENGLGGFVCHDHDNDAETSSICINPTCSRVEPLAPSSGTPEG